VTATCAVATADAGSGSGSGSEVAEAPKKIQKPPEEHVSPVGLIIAGVALAAFAAILLLGRKRKHEPVAPVSELAEVRLVIESDDRATVWTQPSFKLPTDRLGEVVLHLPVGTHEVHIQIGSEIYTRAVRVDTVKRMRLPINIAKERIARTSSRDMTALPRPPVAPEPAPRTKPPTSMARSLPDASTQSSLGHQLAGLIDVELDTPARSLDVGLDPGPSGDRARPAPTSPPKLTLDLSTDLPEDFAAADPLSGPGPGELLPPAPPRPSPLRDAGAGSLPSTPQRPSPLQHVRAKTPTARPSPLADVPPGRSRPQTSPLEGIVKGQPAQPSRPALDISLDEIAPVRPTGKTVPPPVATSELLPHAAQPFRTRTPTNLKPEDLEDLAPSHAPPTAPGPDLPMSSFELAPPTRAPARTASRENLPSVMDFELDVAPTSAPRAHEPFPEVTAASVSDLRLDEDDLPIHRVPVPNRAPSRPVPSVTDLELDDSPLELPARAPQMSAPRPAPMRPMTPVAPTSPLDDLLDPNPGAGRSGLIGDRYQRLAPLGAGPLGPLFRGRDQSGTGDVMIEEVPADARLVAQPAVLAGLSHPNLVRFVDHVVDAGGGHLVSELVVGKSLAQLRLERGSFAALEAIGILDQVCAALGHAHERGVFLAPQPAAIMMSGRTVKVLGFAQTVRPTPYVAPELVAGGRPDVRSDLYAIGVTFVELVTGAVPAARLELPPDVTRPLAGLIRKLLSREPTIRPSTVKAVRDAFSSIF